MNKKKQKALNFRLKGYSYNEIKQLLNIPKSTQSGWFKDLELSEIAKNRLQRKVYQGSVNGLMRRNKLQTQIAIQQAKRIKREAKRDIKEISLDDLRLIGAALYWAEGYKRVLKQKTCHVVSISNSDPQIIRIMMKFFRKTCLVPERKFRLSLRIYPHMNERKTKIFWAQLTNLPFSQFQKTSYAISQASQGKRPKNRLLYGTIQIRIYDTKLFHKIMGWIEGIYTNAGVV